ncbi:hypothetical protein ASPACDRAFT_53404 [Aspergillus aculeatus ATCC 16872]|uniref:Altered inheritance of mitochondria protein 9, mitochondrial n=1 Tax=Aspergillus aculeatus (strain ATCC 16872 / CBS 172.66 / WB 5094) TaxID=690307 RepID=A0A1L9WQW9_ASPA1|nr:uncharacterized protein ASPACDRAFT_53404 [Aspergillus aculeatus ATCC 16872]OJJ98580.1 hypothetical protein ASPACDRAFT_53404 [Aspergillus aculeatus ATCC 16872]
MDPRFKIPLYLSKSISPFGFDPYTYTSGRWLRDNYYERSSHYIAFDFGALCDRILQLCPDAISIDSCKKLKKGFNRVFVFTINNSKQLVAKLPFVLAGPAHLVTSSEVATIRYRESSIITQIYFTNRNASAQSASLLLFHPDLYKCNIFVSEEDPTIITGIIDWQGASIKPAFCLLKYKRAYRLFVAAQNLRYDLLNLLNSASNGWVPTENWEVTQTVYKKIFDGMLQAVLSNQNPKDNKPV